MAYDLGFPNPKELKRTATPAHQHRKHPNPQDGLQKPLAEVGTFPSSRCS